MTTTASAKVFDADLDNMNRALRESGAVITEPDEDGLMWITNTTNVPAGLLRAYRGLLSYGYANGLI